MKPGDVITLPVYRLPSEAMPQVFEHEGVKFGILQHWKVYTVEDDAVIEKVNIQL